MLLRSTHTTLLGCLLVETAGLYLQTPPLLSSTNRSVLLSNSSGLCGLQLSLLHTNHSTRLEIPSSSSVSASSPPPSANELSWHMNVNRGARIVECAWEGHDPPVQLLEIACGCAAPAGSIDIENLKDITLIFSLGPGVRVFITSHPHDWGEWMQPYTSDGPPLEDYEPFNPEALPRYLSVEKAWESIREAGIHFPFSSIQVWRTTYLREGETNETEYAFQSDPDHKGVCEIAMIGILDKIVHYEVIADCGMHVF